MEDELELDGPNSKKGKSLAECKLAAQQLRYQLETHEKDLKRLEKQKQDYFLETIGWCIMFFVAVIIRNVIQSLRQGLPTGSAILIFVLLMDVVCIVVLVKIVFSARHLFGMTHPRKHKFMRWQALLDEETMMLEHVRRLSAAAEEELTIKLAEEEELTRRKAEAAINEERRILSRWDNKDEKDIPLSEETQDLNDTARIIFEALKADEPKNS